MSASLVSVGGELNMRACGFISNGEPSPRHAVSFASFAVQLGPAIGSTASKRTE
jgi:hypothetical protein